jgi:sulfur carrier protein
MGMVDRLALMALKWAFFLMARGGLLEIVVNGERREVAERLSIAALLEALEISSRGVAVEVNFELAPRSVHEERTLAAGDHVEIVTLVGGG